MFELLFLLALIYLTFGYALFTVGTSDHLEPADTKPTLKGFFGCVFFWPYMLYKTARVISDMSKLGLG